MDTGTLAGAYAIALVAGAAVPGYVAWVRARWQRVARRMELALRIERPLAPILGGAIGSSSVAVSGSLLGRARAEISVGSGFYVGPRRAPVRPGEGTGDAAFDEVVSLHAHHPAEWIAARLDHETRRNLREFVRLGGTVSLGSISIRAERPETAHSIELAVYRALRVQQLLEAPVDVPAVLARNAAQDPEFQVREKCLALLAQAYPGEVAAKSCRDAELDPDPGVRLVGAVFLRAEGILALQRLVSDPTVPESIVAKAIAHAAAICTPQTAEAVFETLACGFQSVPSIHAQAIHSAAKIQWWTGISGRIAAVHTIPPLARVALATALTRFPDHDAECEQALVALLGDADVAVRRTAVAALGAIASIAVVEHLLPIGSSRLDLESRRLAIDAIQRIQSRQVGAGAGQLSLEAEALLAEDGRLELATQGGELAVATEGGELAVASDGGELAVASEEGESAAAAASGTAAPNAKKQQPAGG